MPRGVRRDDIVFYFHILVLQNTARGGMRDVAFDINFHEKNSMKLSLHFSDYVASHYFGRICFPHYFDIICESSIP